MKVKGNLQVSGTTEGITFTDGTTTYSNKSQLQFSRTDFYFDTTSSGFPVVNIRNPYTVVTPTIRFTDDVNDYPTASRLSMSGGGFYLSRGSAGQPVLNLRMPIIRGYTVEYPATNDSYIMFKAPTTLRVIGGSAVQTGGTSITIGLVIHPDRSTFFAAGTQLGGQTVTSTTTGQIFPSSVSGTISAGNWVGIIVTAMSGTVSELHATVYFEPV